MASRRSLFTALGAGAVGIGVLSACSTQQSSGAAPAAQAGRPPECVLSPEAIEGPYYIDRDLVRSDLVEDQRGVPLSLRLTVLNASSCTPVEGAVVDIWHCNARGYYSGHLDLDPNQAPMPDPHVDPTDGSTFLRGTQITDVRGVVEFRTIFPGWYFGRAIHIHAMLHAGGKRVHTGQLYFPEEDTAKVMRLDPYADRPAQPQRTTNDADFIYQQEGGTQSTFRLKPHGPHTEDGYSASMTLGVDPTKTPPPAPLTLPPH